MKTAELVSYLDEYLGTSSVPDYPGAMNGLQVVGADEIAHVCVAVDACLYTIRAAVAAGAGLLLVHHGLFWSTITPLTGRRYERVAACVKAGLGIYSSHLPLDAHPEVGNNALLARALGLVPERPFGDYEGLAIGCIATAGVPRGEFTDRVQTAVDGPAMVLPCGPDVVSCVAIVTGAGASEIHAAARAGADTLVTGEAPHHAYFDAEELGINLVLAGHYATETFGVRALGSHVTERFGLPHSFLHHPTGL